MAVNKPTGLPTLPGGGFMEKHASPPGPEANPHCKPRSPPRPSHLRIPLKAIGHSGGSRSGFREETDQAPERSNAGTPMLTRLIGIVKRNLSGANRRKDGRSEDGGVGQGAAIPCLASAHRGPGARTALWTRWSQCRFSEMDVGDLRTIWRRARPLPPHSAPVHYARRTSTQLHSTRASTSDQ